MTNTALSQGHPTLSDEDRDAIGVELQAILVTLVDVSLLGKHAHWNVVGPHFRSLHLQLDEMIESWREFADAVAERAVALGYAPDGRLKAMIGGGNLTPLPDGRLLDRDLVVLLTRTLTEVVDVVRAGMGRVEDLDVVTSDLLHSVAAKLEEQLWMVRVQAG